MKKKRGKRRRSVRCKLCTPHRWMGNTKDRFKAKDYPRRYNKKVYIENEEII